MRTLNLRRCMKCKRRKPLNRENFGRGWQGQFSRVCKTCSPMGESPVRKDPVEQRAWRAEEAARRAERFRRSWIDVCVLVQLRAHREAG